MTENTKRCPKCSGKLVNTIYYVGGQGYVNFLDCENTLKFGEDFTPICEYTVTAERN